MRRGHLLKRLLPLTALLFMYGCGYHFTGQFSRLPETIRTVSIPVFENDSNEPNLDLEITTTVTRQIMRDGRLKIADGGADSVLNGTIKKYYLEPIAFDSLNRVSQYRVKMSVLVSFHDTMGKGVQVERLINVQWDYSVDASIAGSEKARQYANVEAARYLGDRIIGFILEGF